MLSFDGSANIKALNGSGKSSENTNIANLHKKNIHEITTEMPDAITIPGAVAGWSLLHEEHGYMPWKEIFHPAIDYAKSGVLVHERVGLDWSKNTEKLSKDKDTLNVFLKNGKPFKVTDNFINSNFGNEYDNFLKQFNINKKFILDKTLTNFWYIGFIKIFFPKFF